MTHNLWIWRSTSWYVNVKVCVGLRKFLCGPFVRGLPSGAGEALAMSSGRVPSVLQHSVVTLPFGGAVELRCRLPLRQSSVSLPFNCC